MNSFYEHHKDSIHWHYRCFDRILLNGLIQPFQQPERVVGFFNTYRQLYPVTRYTLRDIADQFQRWVTERAEKRNIPIVEAPKGRRDDFVDPRARLPLPAILRPYLPQPAPLAGQPHARERHRIQANRQCFLEMHSSRSPARTRQLAHPSRSGDLWPKVADERVYAPLAAGLLSQKARIPGATSTRSPLSARHRRSRYPRPSRRPKSRVTSTSNENKIPATGTITV